MKLAPIQSEPSIIAIEDSRLFKKECEICGEIQASIRFYDLNRFMEIGNVCPACKPDWRYKGYGK